MRKMMMLGGGSAIALASAILTRNNQPTEQATAGRHRGREFTGALRAPSLGKTERA